MRNRCAGAKSIALGIVCVVCVVLVICVISLDRAFSALCGEVTFSQGQSADGAYGATAYEIDCGAVGDFNLKVKLTKKLESGASTERHVLGVMGRFRASFEWPERRLLRVTVTCLEAGQCTDAETENVRKAVALSDRRWQALKIEYAVK
jgi:hypothetical protein